MAEMSDRTQDAAVRLDWMHDPALEERLPAPSTDLPGVRKPDACTDDDRR